MLSRLAAIHAARSGSFNQTCSTAQVWLINGPPVLDPAGDGGGRAEPVLLRVGVAMRLDEGDQRCVERGRRLPHLLDHDLPGLNTGTGAAPLSPRAEQSTCSTSPLVATSPSSSTIRSDLDGSHPAEPDHVIDRAQVRELGATEHGGSKHGGRHLRVKSHESTLVLEPLEAVGDICRLRSGLGIERDALDERGHLVERLQGRPVGEPGITGANPPDVLGGDAVVEQPQAGVSARLPTPDDGEAAVRIDHGRQIVHRDHSGTRRDGEARLVGGGDRALQILRVHQSAAHLHRVVDTGAQVTDPVLALVTAEVVVLRQELDSPGRDEAVADVLEVGPDLWCVGLLVEPGVPAALPSRGRGPAVSSSRRSTPRPRADG